MHGTNVTYRPKQRTTMCKVRTRRNLGIKVYISNSILPKSIHCDHETLCYFNLIF